MSENFKKEPTPVIEIVKEIGEVYKGNDWLIVKKYLMRYLHPTLRRNFSTRNDKSKKHSLNEYEKNLIEEYYKLYGIRLVLHEKNKD